MRGPALTPDEEARVCDLYAAGHGITPLARRFRVGEETVRAVLKRHNVERRPAGRPVVGVHGTGFCPRRASILHLVDLKRAGYSARQTELRVAPDALAGPAPFRPSLIHSASGSPAAMCAVEG